MSRLSSANRCRKAAAPDTSLPARCSPVRDRNRIRRKLREIVRTHRAALAAFDVIIRVKRAANRIEQDAAAGRAQRLLLDCAARG